MPKPSKTPAIVRSSAAEYLIFIAATGQYEDENIRLTQKMMAALYDVSVSAIRQHLKRIFKDSEQREATVKKCLTVQTEGRQQARREKDRRYE